MAGSVDSSFIAGSQFYAPYGLAIESGTSITIENSGTNSASGGTNSIGYIAELITSSPATYGGSQLDLGNGSANPLPPLSIGDNVNIKITNIGTDSSTGGVNSTGYVTVKSNGMQQLRDFYR